VKYVEGEIVFYLNVLSQDADRVG